MSTEDAVSNVLADKDVAVALWRELSVGHKGGFLETLRKRAIASHSPHYFSWSPHAESLVDIESVAIQKQFEAIDSALYRTLATEHKLDVLKTYTRTDDPDLPDDPTSLTDPKIAYRYAMMRLYRRQFEIIVNVSTGGCWPLLLVDVLEPVDGKRMLMIQEFPEAVDGHPSPSFLTKFSSSRLRTMQAVFADTYAGLARRVAIAAQAYSDTLGQRMAEQEVKDMAKQLSDMERLCKLIGDMDKDTRFMCDATMRREQAELEAAKATQERANEQAYKDRFGGREPREIDRSSDYVDRFDRNHDTISRTC